MFIEKEGFTPLWQRARIAEKFDVMLMSTKGMSVVAARRLLDSMASHIDRVLVAHDFDVSGFSIFATLAGDNRRYTYRNRVTFIDIGLHLTDIEEMDLQSEPVTNKNWEADAARMAARGATTTELAFLRAKRVELNAMTAPQFVDWLERKLVENSVAKVVPAEEIMLRHARRIIQRREAEKFLATMPEMPPPALPSDLKDRVQKMLKVNPALPWDEAIARVIAEFD